MKRTFLAASFIPLFSFAFVPAVHAEGAGKFSLETGMHYNSGTYGGTQSTDILYVPFTGKYQGKSWTLELTVPYLQITGPGNVISVINGVGLTGASGTSSTPVTRSGLGDVVASASHNVYNGGASGFFVNLTGKVKFGTASPSKGLGTGKNDYSLQSDIYQVTGKLTTFGTIGYRVYGRPSGYTLNNAFFGWVGGSYKFAPDTDAGMMLELGQKVTPTTSNRTEALLFVSQKLDRHWKAEGYVLKGLTHSVPDWGAGATLAYHF